MAETPAEARIMDEIHEIRQRIQEEIKDMTSEEVSAYFANATREVEKMYGITFRRPEGQPARKVI